MMRLSRIGLAAWLLLASAAFAAPNAFVIPSATGSQQSALTIPSPTYTDAIVLVATVSQTQAVPAGSVFVVFSGNCDFYGKLGSPCPRCKTTLKRIVQGGRSTVFCPSCQKK